MNLKPVDRFIVFVGDDLHPPRERCSYRYWGCVERWLFEHCYIDEPMATAEKGRIGKFHAVIRERFTNGVRARVVISQSKHWKYDLDPENKWSIVWINRDKAGEQA